MRGNGTVPLWVALAAVRLALVGDGRVELFAVRAVGGQPDIVLEGYDDTELLVGGALPVWELNQAVAALIAAGSQARRLAIRDDGRGHAGYVDLLCDGDEAHVFVNRARDRRTAVLGGSRLEIAADLNRVLQQFLRMTRVASSPRVVVLPDAAREVVPSA